MTQREEQLLAENEMLRSARVDWYAVAREIFERIEHGDDEHRAWLKRELDLWAEARDGR